MLAGERHAQRPHRHVPDGDRLRGHEREPLVRHVGRRQGAHDLAGGRTPHREGAEASGDVGERYVEVAEPRLLAQPGEVMGAVRRPGDHPEPVLVEPGHGEVGLDAAARVERLGVGHVTDAAGYGVVADPLQEGRGVRTPHLDLGERGLVEDARRRTRRPMLGRRSRRPVTPGPSARPEVVQLGRRVGGVVVDPLPAGLLAEGRVAGLVPGVDGRDPQRPARQALELRDS